MIASFKHKGLKNLFLKGSAKGVQPKHVTKLRLMLATLNQASKPSDMNAPAWRLHPLSGDRDGEWSVAVDENYRLTFAFNDEGDAVVVDYGDYH